MGGGAGVVVLALAGPEACDVYEPSVDSGRECGGTPTPIVVCLCVGTGVVHRVVVMVECGATPEGGGDGITNCNA